MGMYAVMYRLRRVRFFYQLFFYFNYVTAPALILLPAWIANEVLQHFFSGQSAGYMAHLGGLLTGATLMALHLRRKPRAALAGCPGAGRWLRRTCRQRATPGPGAGHGGRPARLARRSPAAACRHRGAARLVCRSPLCACQRGLPPCG